MRMLINFYNHNNLSTDCRNELYHETTGFYTQRITISNKKYLILGKYINNPFVKDLPIEKTLVLAKNGIDRMRSKRARKLNENRHHRALQVNNKVLVKSHPLSRAAIGEKAKLFEVYDGPFIIKQKLGDSIFHITDLDGQVIYGPYQISSLKFYIEPKIEDVKNELQEKV